MDMHTFKISVRGLVEFVYRYGDLDLRFQGKSKMAEGIKVHQKIQKSQGADYKAEVHMQTTVLLESDGIELLINGRADGVLKTDTGYIIDEIKGTSQFVEDIEIETYPVHWAQAKIYGAIFCSDHGLEDITIQLTYAHFESGNIHRLREVYTRESLKSFLMETVERYKIWLIFKRDWQLKRTSSLNDMTFPYENYRKGQRNLAISIYNTVREGGVLYTEAPTGIGKTMSTLFPGLKAMAQGHTERIFYLSAKTITKVVAEDALKRLHHEADTTFHLKHITLTAKDKICLNEKVTCYPEKCAYAKGYFDKSLEAIWDIINNEDAFTKETLVRYAQKYTLCPYEFSLDVALFSDVVICDYNYAFDPRVYLRRFFEMPSESYVLLVDEAHNLVDRARTMFSVEICKDKFYDLKKSLVEKDRTLSKALEGINKMFLSVRKRCDDKGVYVSLDADESVYETLKKRAQVFEKWLTDNHQADYYDVVLERYFDILGYMRIGELYDSGFVFYIEEGHTTKTTIKLFCINPASQLKRFIDASVATVFFSATLSPMNYYAMLLSGEKSPKGLILPSPFDARKCKTLFATDVSVKYKDRDDAAMKIVHYIHAMAKAKVGNYMVFFPSHAYMHQVLELFEHFYRGKYDIIKQKRTLSEDEKVEYLEAFSIGAIEKSRIGFTVLGGHFSEGIDLKGDLLIGVMVIGVGLPMISFENDLIKHHFDYEYGTGFEFAYQYPGLNKVMQSAGRVIRDDDDRGVVILVDQRYQQNYYRNILPKTWGKETTSIDTVEGQLVEFWEE